MQSALHMQSAHVHMQEQAKAARQGAAGTMDEYTFVGEDASQGSPPGNATAQGLSEEQQYRAEMLQEMQVRPCCVLTSATSSA